MRCVSIAICTCGEPVSASLRPCFVMISCFASLVRANALSLLSPPQAPPTALRFPEPRERGASRAWAAGRVAESGMASAIPQEHLAEIVRDARARTGVPAVTAGLLVGGRVELAAAGPVEIETPFRIASITKWFTASLATLLLDLDAPSVSGGPSAGSLLSHT